MINILILCTGNSCRSQMAEGVLKSLGDDLAVFSAGTEPADEVHSYAIRVMSEIGIDISANRPKNVDCFLQRSFDYVITVCDQARETCPVFTGNVKHRLHMGFNDPAVAVGWEENVLAVFREVCDRIQQSFKEFHIQIMKEGK